MKQKILLLSVVTLLSQISIHAQSRKAYAITGERPESVNWVAFREIDLNSGNTIQTIYSPTQNDIRYDALTGNAIAVTDNINTGTKLESLYNLNEEMVAAAAFDERNSRLYYTTMKGSQLAYFQIKNGVAKNYIVRDQVLRNFEPQSGEGSVFTRMTMSANGFGYALTNDGEHLVRFTTGEKIAIKDLGSLKDGENNTNNSVHNASFGWGGDMISDANGTLYLFTMKGKVYQINPATMVTNYLGTIKNLPASFSVNATAVNENGKVVLACANASQGLYTVNLNTFEATKINAEKIVEQYNMSDLASSNFLNANNNRDNQYIVSEESSTKGNALINVWPNPVQNRIFTIEFNNISGENFIVQLTDMNGRSLMEKRMNIVPHQTESIALTSNILNGNYVLKVIGSNSEIVYTGKIVVD